MAPSPSHHTLPTLLCLLLPTLGNLRADVALPPIFSDHMVLQQAARVPIWGKADPGEKVVVTLGNSRGEAITDDKGKWRVSLDLSNAPAKPASMLVEGKNKIEINDVLVGEVWICAGQSNMEFQLSRAIGAESETAAPANPNLREFKVKRANPVEPLEQCEGQWVVATPESVGKFSGVGYFFGKQLQTSLGKPVGLICAAVGATPSEAWTSYAALSNDADLKNATDRDITYLNQYPETKKQFVEAYRAWEQKYQREDKPDKETILSFATLQDKNGWNQLNVPMKQSTPGFDAPGSLWLVRSFDYAAPDGKDLSLSLGTPEGYDSVYWNGQKLDQRTYANFRGEGEARGCVVPGKLIKEGKNILAIRIFNAIEAPRLTGKVSQAGEWSAKMETSLSPLSDDAKNSLPPPLKFPPDPKQTGTLLFNGMISPLIPYAIAGVVWYQGENNAERAWQYRKAFPMMIEDWRAQWGQGPFPFYFCQLANYHAKGTTPGESDWAELREAQTSALSLPNTGQAILIDIGEAGDIHPRNKKDAGERLAAIALAKTYNKNQPFSGPAYKSMSVEGSKIRIQFEHIENGLTGKKLPETHWLSSKANKTEKLTLNSPGSEIEGFAICGADHKWVWANAEIEGDSVLVHAESVINPVAVRYAWAKNPTCNLYNGAGFPAAPFRTDNIKATTMAQKY